jgi:hypothetical protein
MKVSYSFAKNRASPHCITWVYRKKRNRKFFKSRIDAVRFQSEKERDLGLPNTNEIENEVIFLALTEIKDRLDGMELRLGKMENSFLKQESHLNEMRKPPAPKILKVSEAAKVLRVSSRKLYYLLAKGVFKRYKLPHTRTTFIKLDEVEKALGTEDISELLSGN